MAKQPKGGGITWTNETWNPIRGCSRVSEGCRNCYAERAAARFSGTPRMDAPGVHHRHGGGRLPKVKDAPYAGLAVMLADGPHWTGEVRFIEERLSDPLHWRKPRRIFVNSMSDLFHEKVPIEWIARIFAVMASATADCGKKHKHEPECWCGPSHVYQVLTKRPERMLEVMQQLPDYCAEHFNGDSAINLAFDVNNGWPLPNVWLGVSVEDQNTADERIPLLLQTPAAVRWVSYEPALGPVSFRWAKWEPMKRPGTTNEHDGLRRLDWIVAGGESGPGARPAHPDWFRQVRDQCMAAGVPFFFKPSVGARRSN